MDGRAGCECNGNGNSIPVAIFGCGILGLFSGSMVAYFGVPSFVASLGMMMVAAVLHI